MGAVFGGADAGLRMGDEVRLDLGMVVGVVGRGIAGDLSVDVRRAALQNLRALPDRSGWTIMGFSAGGYCATNLAMLRPGMVLVIRDVR